MHGLLSRRLGLWLPLGLSGHSEGRASRTYHFTRDVARTLYPCVRCPPMLLSVSFAAAAYFGLSFGNFCRKFLDWLSRSSCLSCVSLLLLTQVSASALTDAAASLDLKERPVSKVSREREERRSQPIWGGTGRTCVSVLGWAGLAQNGDA